MARTMTTLVSKSWAITAPSSPAFFAGSELSSPITILCGGHVCCPPRTTRTGQWAWWTTPSETLPARRLPTGPNPRLPSTTSPAPSSSPRLKTSSIGGPYLRKASVTVPPMDSIWFTCFVSSS